MIRSLGINHYLVAFAKPYEIGANNATTRRTLEEHGNHLAVQIAPRGLPVEAQEY